jgi:tRNA A-37 threonylcarbamoyl transferase component Bud32/tetratricopeptide (TPR) repeat protein
MDLGDGPSAVRRTKTKKDRTMRPSVDDLLEHQRVSWQRGEASSVEQYLADHPALAADEEGIIDLIYHEFVLRADHGPAPSPQEYFQRFPQYRIQLETQFAFLDLVETVAYNRTHTRERAAATFDPRATRTSECGAAPFPLPSSAESLPPTPRADHWPRLGRYDILGELGRGATGIVYKARQHGLQRLVAVKTIYHDNALRSETRSRFRREAETVARLHHPNIIQIHEVGEEEGRLFFSMELAEGVSLRNKVAGASLPPHQAARLLETLARAIHHAHQQGVVHRDLKPDNILLSGNAEGALEHCSPKIADFGLAKHLDSASLSHTDAVVGTPNYMAPEQAGASGRQIGPAADIYALGAILYELLTGRPPFQGSFLEVLDRVRSQAPPQPSCWNPGLPRDLETICLKCLEKEPSRRYATAEALAADLQRFLEGKPIQARPVALPSQVWRWCRRKPAVAGLMAALVFVVSISFGVVVSFWWQARDSEKNAVERRRQAEAAQRNAEDQRAKTVRLLAEVAVFVSRMPRENPDQGLPMDMLIEVEAHYRNLLAKRPEDIELWQALAHACYEQSFRLSMHKQMDQARQAVRRGEQAFQQVVRLRETGNPDELAFLSLLIGLMESHQALQEPAAALSIARQAAAFAARAARSTRRDLEYRFQLAKSRTTVSHLLRKMGAAGEALAQVEMARQLTGDLVREAPGDLRYTIGLRDTCYELGKIRWKLEQYDNALAAFREAVQAQRQAFDRAPEVPVHRQELSHFYERLAYWLRQRGGLAEASDYYMQQKKLWPGKARQLLEIAENLAELANEVGGGRVELTPTEKEERQRYLGLSEQVAKEAVVKR